MNVVHGRYCILRSDQGEVLPCGWSEGMPACERPIAFPHHHGGGPVLRQRGARPSPRLAVRSGREWCMIMGRVTLTMQ